MSSTASTFLFAFEEFLSSAGFSIAFLLEFEDLVLVFKFTAKHFSILRLLFNENAIDLLNNVLWLLRSLHFSHHHPRPLPWLAHHWLSHHHRLSHWLHWLLSVSWLGLPVSWLGLSVSWLRLSVPWLLLLLLLLVSWIHSFDNNTLFLFYNSSFGLLIL